MKLSDLSDVFFNTRPGPKAAKEGASGSYNVAASSHPPHSTGKPLDTIGPVPSGMSKDASPEDFR